MRGNVGNLSGWLLFFWAVALLLVPLPWVCALVVATAVHEFGHLLAVLACGGSLQGVAFSTAGACISARLGGRKQQILCYLAGPVTGGLLVCFCRFLPRIAICAAAQSLFNLLPIYPLDGGKVMHCLADALGLESKVCDFVEICALAALFAGCIWLRMGFIPKTVLGFVIYRTLQAKIPCKRRRF